MIDLLIERPILLLVVAAALGYLLGQIKIKGSSLGISAVLFAGLGVGALHPDIEPPSSPYAGPRAVLRGRRHSLRPRLLQPP